MDVYRNQIGIAYIEYLLGGIWGDFNAVAFQLLNVAGLALLYKKLSDILELWNTSRRVVIFTLLAGVVFTPLIMYTSFVYGTIWSVTLALMAFAKEYKFFDDKKWWRLILMGLAMVLGIQVKNNVLIFAVAMVIYAAVSMFRDKKEFKAGILAIVAIVIGISILSLLPVKAIEHKTDTELNQGISSWAFVAMGLQEGDKAPGWWNSYNYTTYADCGYNTAAQEALAKEEVENRIQVFKSNKQYTFCFFSQKLASMWTEPTYQSFWVNQIRLHRVDFPGWLVKLMSVDGYNVAAKVMNPFQLLIFGGAALWLVTENKNLLWKKSFLVMVFIGGFLFHTVWEAKSQYSITYFVLLLPCAIMGYENAICLLSTKAFNHFRNMAAAMLILTIVGYCGAYLAIGDSCLTTENGTYSDYCAAWVAPNTDESINDLAYMKVKLEGDEGVIVYLEKVLNDNGIAY